MTMTTLIIMAVVGFGAGFFKSGFGIGSGVFFTPFLAMFMEPKVVMGMTAPLMLVTDVTSLQIYWRKWDWHAMKLLVPTGLAGIVAGSLFLAHAPAGQVRKVIGLFALIFALNTARRLWLSRNGNGQLERPGAAPAAATLIGVAGGISSAVAHTGGIIYSFYMLPRMTKVVYVASLALLLLIGDLFKMVVYWQVGVLSWPEVVAGVLLTPVMFAGSWLGGRINGRLSERGFLVIVMALVFVTGILLLFR